MSTTRHQARVAGWWYLTMAVIAPIGLLVVPGQLVVAGDATATADRIRASEWILRAGIGSEIVHQALAIPLALALYRLFRPVHEGLARLVVILGALVSVPIMFMNVVNSLATLALVAHPPFLASVFTGPQMDALAYFFLRLHGKGIDVASVFWGLWLFPFATLVVRSGFIPRVFGYLLYVAGAAYLVSAFATLVMPPLAKVVGPYLLPLETCEVPIVFWLAIWGARERPAPLPSAS